MKAILINPEAESIPRRITEVEYNESLPETYRLLDCDVIEGVTVDSEHMLFVDEHGKLRRDMKPPFRIRRSKDLGPLVIHGRALVVRKGLNGECLEPTLGLVDIAWIVDFICPTCGGLHGPEEKHR